MKKDELISQAWDIVRSQYGRSLKQMDMECAFVAVCEVIAAELLGGGDVPLPGMGKLKVKETHARRGRNPKTGEEIEIPAGKKVVFSPSKEFKESLS